MDKIGLLEFQFPSNGKEHGKYKFTVNATQGI